MSNAHLLLYVSGGAYFPDCHLPDTLPQEPSVPQEFNGEFTASESDAFECCGYSRRRTVAPPERQQWRLVVQLLCVRVERHVPSGGSMLPQVCSERSASSRRSSQSISELTRPDACMSSAQSESSVI